MGISVCLYALRAHCVHIWMCATFVIWCTYEKSFIDQTIRRLLLAIDEYGFFACFLALHLFLSNSTWNMPWNLKKTRKFHDISINSMSVELRQLDLEWTFFLDFQKWMMSSYSILEKTKAPPPSIDSIFLPTRGEMKESISVPGNAFSLSIRTRSRCVCYTRSWSFQSHFDANAGDINGDNMGNSW